MSQINIKIQKLSVLCVVLFLVLAAIYHIYKGPYPTVWDDANYAESTFRWLDTLHEEGIIKGVLTGLYNQLPSQYPPMVFITSLVGVLLDNSLLAMRLSHLFWFVVTLWACYRIGFFLNGYIAGIFAVLIVGTMPPVFYWSQMIMGEPSLFALVTVFLLFIIKYGDSLSSLRGGLAGAIIGLGLLTKQHFWVIVILPISIWLFWLFYKKLEKRTILPVIKFIFALVIGMLAVAGTWYFLHIKELLAYALQPDFKPHLLGSSVSWSTIFSQMLIILGTTGFMSIVLSIIGAVTGTCSLLNLINKKNYNDWSNLAPIVLLSAALINVLAAVLLRSSNPRFFAPVFIPLGLLSSLAMSRLWTLNNQFVKAIVSLLLVIQVIMWGNICFGVLPPEVINKEDSFQWARPQDISPLLNAIDYLSSKIGKSSKDQIRLVGATNLFNPPLIRAIVLEKRFNWQIAPLYRWSEKDLNEETLNKRLHQFDWLVVQRYGGTGSKLLSKYDEYVKNVIRSSPEKFDMVWSAKSASSHNEIEIYRLK